ncbi:MAG: hypothetical protein UEJ45_00125 [Peptococcaceae bacterium]|nr:hypothetical protein [Peptococcaceae bacterium]
MRIFIFILSLIFSVACALLNVLGFNGTLTYNEFFLVNIITEIFLCLLLGHFMFRTYANRKKLKKLQQEMTTRQASSTAQEQSSKKKFSFLNNHHTSAPTAQDKQHPQPAPQQSAAPRAPQQAPHAPKQAPQQQDPRRAPIREQAPSMQQTSVSNATAPMHTAQPQSQNMDSTTLYKTPFGK